MAEKEKLIYVPPPIKKLPFFVTLAGITYENTNYYIERKNSPEIVVEYVISGKGHIERDGKKQPYMPGICTYFPLEMTTYITQTP